MCAHPSFGMTTTKTLRSVFSWHTSHNKVYHKLKGKFCLTFLPPPSVVKVIESTRSVHLFNRQKLLEYLLQSIDMTSHDINWMMKGLWNAQHGRCINAGVFSIWQSVCCRTGYVNSCYLASHHFKEGNDVIAIPLSLIRHMLLFKMFIDMISKTKYESKPFWDRNWRVIMLLQNIKELQIFLKNNFLYV